MINLKIIARPQRSVIVDFLGMEMCYILAARHHSIAEQHPFFHPSGVLTAVVIDVRVSHIFDYFDMYTKGVSFHLLDLQYWNTLLE